MLWFHPIDTTAHAGQAGVNQGAGNAEQSHGQAHMEQTQGQSCGSASLFFIETLSLMQKGACSAAVHGNHPTAATALSLCCPDCLQIWIL